MNSSVRSQPYHQFLSDMCWLPTTFTGNCLGPTLGRGIDIVAKSVDTNQIDAIGCRLQPAGIHFK